MNLFKSMREEMDVLRCDVKNRNNNRTSSSKSVERPWNRNNVNSSNSQQNKALMSRYQQQLSNKGVNINNKHVRIQSDSSSSDDDAKKRNNQPNAPKAPV